MKRFFTMMLFFLVALGSYAGDKVRGVLRTEINGFQWYCYKNKEAYSVEGKRLTGKSVESVEYVVADKNDEGVFVFTSDARIDIVKPNGDYIENLMRNTFVVHVGKTKLNYYVSRIPIVFSNPNKKEYFTKVKDQYGGEYYLISKSGKRMIIYGKYTILDNFILSNNKTNDPKVLAKTGTHVYLADGQELGIVDLIEKIGSTNIYKVKDDAYSSYRYLKSNGEEIFKGQYDEIIACSDRYLKVRNGANYGILNIDGKEIIPISRGYTSIGDYDSSKGTFEFTKKGVSGVCDMQGREISTTKLAPTANDIKADGGYASAVEMKNGSTKYYKVSKGGRYGLTDSEGKEIVPCEIEALESAGTGYLKYKINGFWGVMNYAGKIIIDTDRGYTSIGNFVTFTKRFPYTMTGYKGECDINGKQISKIKVETPKQEVAKQETTTSEKKETIIIEHKHDPIPVNVWVQCNICGGSGRCQTCGGSGIFTGPAGNKTLCSFGCGGSGKCSFCAGSGGHYEVEYK